MCKFGPVEVAANNFVKQRQITDIFTIDLNKMVLSDKVSCNNGKDWRYIVGYQINGEKIIPLLIKTPKNVINQDVSQNNKNSACKMSFNLSEAPEWVLQYKNIQNEVESQLTEKLTEEPTKGKDKYMHGKLKTWKVRIKTNSHGQDVPYDIYCNTTAVLKIDPRVHVEECKYADAENQQCSMLSGDDDGDHDDDDDYNDDDDDDGYFEV